MKVILFSIFLSFQAYGCFKLKNGINPKECKLKTTTEQITSITEQLLEKHYPELNKAYKTNLLRFKYYTDDQYFLKATFRVSHIFKRKGKRVLFLHINKNLKDCSPPLSGLKAILIHELEHIKDYHFGRTGDLLRIGKNMLGKKSRARYERATDLKTLEKGYAKGLIDYREWVYKQLKTKKELKRKKRIYYTPEEINAWLASNEKNTHSI